MAATSQGQAVQMARSVGGFQMPSGAVALTPLQLVALIKLGRNAGLDAAKKKVSEIPWIDGASIPSNHEMARAIESLKDNTP